MNPLFYSLKSKTPLSFILIDPIGLLRKNKSNIHYKKYHNVLFFWSVNSVQCVLNVWGRCTVSTVVLKSKSKDLDALFQKLCFFHAMCYFLFWKKIANTRNVNCHGAQMHFWFSHLKVLIMCRFWLSAAEMSVWHKAHCTLGNDFSFDTGKCVQISFFKVCIRLMYVTTSKLKQNKVSQYAFVKQHASFFLPPSLQSCPGLLAGFYNSVKKSVWTNYSTLIIIEANNIINPTLTYTGKHDSLIVMHSVFACIVYQVMKWKMLRTKN